MSGQARSGPSRDDDALAKKLDELHAELGSDNKAGPDVVVIWQAIGRIAARNTKCLEHGEPTFPMPQWINDYLLQSSDKIERLWLGIPPDDDRSLSEIGFANVGVLRKVAHSERFRDARADHVAGALGFVTRGASAFKRHDRASRDAGYLEIHDNPQLNENKSLRDEVRTMLFGVIKKNENIGSDQAIRNRLSNARTARTKARSKP